MKNTLLIFALFALSLSANSADNWNNAQWIWQTADGPANSWVCFRKTVQLESVPENVLAQIAVDSKFWLWVNGELVVFEGGSSRGPSQAGEWDREKNITPSNSWYEEVDIKPYLKQGENTIALLVWYWGRETNKGTYIDSKKGGLLFHCKLGEEIIISDASWKMKRHPGYDENSGDNGTSVVQYNVKYDARNDLNDWSSLAWYTSAYNDSNWLAAVEKGIASSAPWYDLVKNYVPRLINHGLEDYENNSALQFPFVSNGSAIVCQLPFNKQITPYFEIESDAGKVIQITTDNRLNKISANYTTKAGSQNFECFSWMNGQTVIYTIPAGVKVKALKYRWMSVGEMAGSFSVSDPFYERLWWMGRNTLFVCARDNFMDCPDRERALWIGDVADQTGYLFYSMDNAGRQLLKKAIFTTFNFSENKVIGALGPLRVRELPSQSLQFIAQLVWPYYFNTGDTATLKAVYPGVYDYLALWELDSNGLPKYRKWASPDNWDWYDWGVDGTVDKTPIQFALYYMALESAKKMALELGETAQIAWYENRINSIYSAYNQLYWKNGFYSSDVSQFKDDRLNALVILAGLADSSKYEPIVANVLVPNKFSSPHFEWMVEAAMCVAGNYAESLSRMKAQYQIQVNTAGQSTLYEMFPKGGSYNHAWNASNTVLNKYIAGIEPTKVGWSEFRVCPNLVDMTDLQIKVPSVKGNIQVEVNTTPNSYTLNLKSPEGTNAIVGIPKNKLNVKQVKVGEVLIWDNGKFIEGVEGVSMYGNDAKFIQFKLRPGQWNLVAEGTAISVEQKPFTGKAIEIPGKFEAENYDMGGEGLAWHDTDNINQDGEYRSDGVDIGTGGSGHVIGYTNNGEWLEYTINVAEAGLYELHIYYSSGRPGGGSEIEAGFPDEGNKFITAFSLPVTNSWTDFSDITLGKVDLSKGKHTLRLTIIERGFNLDRIEFKRTGGVGIKDVKSKNIEVYPNPSSNGHFKISEWSAWEVYTLVGEKIASGEGAGVDISKYPKGLYILQTEKTIQKINFQ